jgi:hypothetical protein
MKTMAIRLDDELHAQLAVIAQLEGLSINDVIRVAVEHHIAQRKDALSDRAETALAEIEREAAARRHAITTLFGDGPTAAPASGAAETGDKATSRGRGRDGGAAR